MTENGDKFDAWHPGLDSEIPSRLLPLVTLFRPEYSTIGYRQAKTAADFCGLEAKDMIALKIERLTVHELLIRVTADLSVPDGPNYEVLGINLRSMAARILDKYIAPKMQDISHRFEALRIKAEGNICDILNVDIFDKKADTKADENPTGIFQRLFRKEKSMPVFVESAEITALARWQAELQRQDDPFQKACLRSLIAVVGRIVGQRGRLMADRDMITQFALNIFCNTFGSQKVGELIDPIIADAVGAEKYRFLPAQKSRFFMNVKGASAAGKSTIRPQQRRLAERLNIPWEDFALISPDYWRKFLLDYASLGPDYKYAAMLTGQELEIIDKKLDEYMSRKALQMSMPHLLIDRFRFDSFQTVQDSGKNSTLLTRFGDTVYLFFVISPPAATVERAWTRGQETGRYKAVDDLLYHNIEAYTGIPRLFFSWIFSTDKKIHFEFLDNSVAFGKTPRTIAFGWNDNMTILDLDRLNDIDRFQNININATRPEDVFKATSEPQFEFLKDCVARIPQVTLADYDSLKIFGQTNRGKWIYENATVMNGNDRRIFSSALGWNLS
ncbi:MAG: hypothetical protein ACU0DI_00410, partial [Paracoccaceae bacterium]